MRLAAGALALALVAIVPAALAQVPSICAEPDVRLDVAEVRLVPGASRTVNVTVGNPGNVAADAEITFTGPPGMAVRPASAELANIPAGGEGTASVTVTALESAAPGAAGELVAAATLTCGQPPLAQTAGPVEARAALVVDEPPANPVGAALGALRRPEVVAVGGLGLVLLVGAVALRGRREGFGLGCPEPRKAVRAGRGTSFPLEVRNRSAATDTVLFAVGEVPEGWTAFTALPELQLGPREARTVWLMVRAPASAGAGASARVSVAATSKAHPRRVAQVAVLAEVADEAPEAAPAAA